MALLTLFQGKTNVAFYTSGDAPDGEAPVAGALGAVGGGLGSITAAAAGGAIGGGTGAALGAVIGGAAGEALVDVIDDNPDPILTVDVSMQENHSLQTEIVSHEIEDGSEITDHARNVPRVLTISGLITDTPSGLGALSVVGGLTNEFASVPLSTKAFQTLEQIRDEKTILDVVTSLKIYRSMMIEDVRIPRNAMVGRSLQFTIRLREVRFVSSATAGTTTGAGIDGASGTIDLGDQALAAAS